MLEALIGSKARVRLLAELLLRPEEEVHLRDLVGRTGSAPRSVQLEVDRLVALGILRERRSGNRRYLSANIGHSWYAPLRELLERSEGVLPAIRQALAADDRVRRALVYGSVARGEAGPGSDVDLLVVGAIPLRRVVRLLAPVQERLGVEINPVVMTQREFGRRRRTGEHFLTRVLAGPVIELVGEDDLGA